MSSNWNWNWRNTQKKISKRLSDSKEAQKIENENRIKEKNSKQLRNALSTYDQKMSVDKMYPRQSVYLLNKISIYQRINFWLTAIFYITAIIYGYFYFTKFAKDTNFYIKLIVMGTIFTAPLWLGEFVKYKMYIVRIAYGLMKGEPVFSYQP